MTIHSTNEEDLNPRASTVNDHPSVLAHEMMVIESGEKTTFILTWKWLSLVKRRRSLGRSWLLSSSTTSSLVLTMIDSQYLCGRLCFVNNVLVVNLILTLTVITFRRVSVNLQDYHRTNTSCTRSVCCYTQLVTGLKPITSHPLLEMTEVTSR